MKSEQKFQQQSQSEYGDFKILAEVLSAPSPDAARKRFRRNDPDAVEAMQEISKNREEFIKKYKEKLKS